MIFVVVLLGWWTCRHGGRSGAAAGAVSVGVSEVQRKDVPIFVDGLGTVQAFNTVLLRARVDGTLMQLSFTEGQEVKAGDVLAMLDPRPYQSLVDEAVAKKAQDEAQLANARVVLERNARLLKNKVIDQQSFDAAKLAVEQLEAVCQGDQATIDRARTQLDYTQIRSPIDGRTGIRFVDVGNVVLADDPTGIVLITQLKPISVIFTVSEKQLQPILAQQTSGARPGVSVLGAENSVPLAEGELTVVDNQIDQATATVKLKATFPNDDLKLWPGKFVTARLLLTTKTAALVIPATAVQRRANGAYVYVVANERAEIRSIKLGQTQANEATIEEGLKPGEQVIVSGHDKLHPGAIVTVTSPGNQLVSGAPAPRRQPPVAATQVVSTPAPSIVPAVAMASETAPPQPTVAPNATPTPTALPVLAATAPPSNEMQSPAATGEGSFVIGDRNAIVGRKVYFWGPQWAKKNRLSMSTAPKRFGGYAGAKDQVAASCGGAWQVSTQDAARPPSALPPFINVIATSSARQSGSIVSGDNKKIVVVKPDRGYRAKPARAGTGTVVAVSCE